MPRAVRDYSAEYRRTRDLAKPRDVHERRVAARCRQRALRALADVHRAEFRLLYEAALAEERATATTARAVTVPDDE